MIARYIIVLNNLLLERRKLNMAKKYLSLERLTEYDGLIKQEISEGDAAVKSYVDTELAKKANSSHNHNDIYYTETEVDDLIAGVNTSINNIASGYTTVKKAEEATHASSADSATSATDADKLGGQLPSYYAKASDIPTGALADKDIVSESDLDAGLAAKVNAASEGNHSHSNKAVLDGITSDKVSAWDSAEENANAYTDTKTNGMATTTVVDNKISSHNTSATAHSDIRDLISALTTKVNNFLDVDDATTDQLSEVLELIENNKGTLESLTSGKINTSDIVDNLTTANASKVLSANQGVVLKGLIDALQSAVDGKAASSHTHAISEVTNLQTTLNAKASQADLDALEDVVAGKASSTHGHAIADVSGLQSALDGKAAASHGTHVTYDSTNKPKMDGTAAFGTSTSVARADHVHPTDTSRVSQVDFDNHEANETHITSTERTNWNAAKTHADSAHAPSNAQANVIESIKVNGTAQTITSKSVNITVPTKASDIGAATADHTHTVDSALSGTSTNPVQNKVVNQAIVTATNAITANTNSISTHTSQISALQTEVNSWEEITSTEIQSLFAN